MVCSKKENKKPVKSDKQFCEKDDATEIYYALKNECLDSELMVNLQVT